jgi:transcriptional regulator with XRE-family HTH domain
MDIVDRIFDLLKQRNIKQKELSAETGITEGNISDWKKGRSHPTSEAIIKIAKYFDVSTDYLFGLTDNPAPLGNAVTREEKLQRNIALMSPEQRKRAEEYIEFLKSREEFAEELSTALGSLGRKPLTE